MHPLWRSKVRRSVKLGPRDHWRNALPHYVHCLIRQRRGHLSNKLMSDASLQFVAFRLLRPPLSSPLPAVVNTGLSQAYSASQQQCKMFFLSGAWVYDLIRDFSSVHRHQEAATDRMLTTLDAEHHRERRRVAQRDRRAMQDDRERDLGREIDRNARSTARALLSGEDGVQIRNIDTAADSSSRTAAQNSVRTGHWWDHVAQLNLSQVPDGLGLHWNRVCKYCGIKVSASVLWFISFLTHFFRL